MAECSRISDRSTTTDVGCVRVCDSDWLGSEEERHMIEINLIPDVKQELIKAQRIRATVISVSIIVTIASAAVLAILAGYVFGVQTVRAALADGEITAKNKELQANEDLDKILTIQNQLSKISALDSAKNIDSRIFSTLGAIIPPSPNTIQISDLSVNNEQGTITIQGQTATYNSLDVFKKTISGTTIHTGSGEVSVDVPLASEISTTDVSYGEDATGRKVLRFTLSFVYAPELFANDVSNFAIKRPDNGNATDSYLGLPKSLFTDRASDPESAQ